MLKYFKLTIIFLVITCCSSPTRINEELEKALGTSIESTKSIYHDDEFGGFNEGYSIDIVELTVKTIKAFQNSVNNNQYPLKKYDWQVFSWRKTPVLDSLDQIEALVLNYYVLDERERYQDEMRELMQSEDDVYYSFYFKEVAGNIIAVDFYLIDIESKKVYMVKSSM